MVKLTMKEQIERRARLVQLITRLIAKAIFSVKEAISVQLGIITLIVIAIGELEARLTDRKYKI